MKRSILLCNKNYWSSKGTISEDGFIRNQEGKSFRHRIPENKRWKKYLKSQPKSKRERLEKAAIRNGAEQFRKYEKNLKYKKEFRTNVGTKNESTVKISPMLAETFDSLAKQNLIVDLDAGYRKIALDEKLPNSIKNWVVKREPKVWNSSAGGEYIRKWQNNCMTILDSNKNVITVKDAMESSTGKPKLNVGVVPYYAVVPVDIRCGYSTDKKTEKTDFTQNTWNVTSKANFRRLHGLLRVPNVNMEEAVDRFKPEEPIFDRLKGDLFNGCSFVVMFVCMYQLVSELQNL